MTLTEALIHLHSHPKMEARLGVPADHVIIDRGVYIALICNADKEFNKE